MNTVTQEARMPTKPGRMTPEEFRAALEILGETTSTFAQLLVDLGDSANDKQRTVQRWAAGTQDIPGPVQAVLQLLVLMLDQEQLSPTDVRRWLADAVPDDNSAS